MTKQKLLAIVSAYAFTIATLSAQCLDGNCNNGTGTYLFDSGAKYTGTFRSGKMNGQGTLRFTNGNVYNGSFVNQYREGQGKMTYKNGDVFVGTFQKSHIENGKMAYANGDSYEGGWSSDMPQGNGTYRFKSGEVYSGAFVRGRFEGQGRMTFPDKSYYEGQWKDNKRNGEGSMVYNNGTKQKGLWINGEFRGANGTAVANNSRVTSNTSTTKPNTAKPNTPSVRPAAKPAATRPVVDESTLRNCNEVFCREGQGVFTYGDGSRWVGDMAGGLPEGSGTLHYINKDRYEGQFYNHAPHGEGVMHYANGRVYGALWKEGAPVGRITPKQNMPTNQVTTQTDSKIKMWAVVVGIGDYEHMPTLKYTDDDAFQVYSFLKSAEGGALPDNQIALLTEQDATRDDILSGMREMFLRADENDIVFFYFSGHGIPGSFLPIDYDGYNNQLTHDDVRKILTESRAKHKICIADACYSGSIMARKDGSLSNAQLVERFYGAFERTSGGVALLMSSKSEEYSLEDQGLRSGVFSYFLIKGLRGIADLDGNKIVTITELYNYVNKGVSEYTGRLQNPVISGQYDAKMPISVVR